MAKQKINTSQSAIPYKVINLYPSFYTQPNQTGSTGNSYSFTENLPRAVLTGETVIMIPISAKWCSVELNGITGTQFSFTLNCLVNTSLMNSRWTAIYYRAD